MNFLDWLLAGLRAEGFLSRKSMSIMVDFTRNAPDVASLAWPNRLSWAAFREFGNKLDAFQAFATADQWINEAGAAKEELVQSAIAVSDRSDFLGLWTIEGLGYYCATLALKRVEALDDFLLRNTKRLPEKCLIPLHTGMGLALASHAIHCLSQSDHAPDVRGCVERYVRQCREISQVGYAGATLEALGLIVVLLRPSLLLEIDRHLGDFDSDLRATFWHGVGRGLYFTPTNLLPCTSAAWPSLNRVLHDPPHELGRQNALAGLAWAMTLVNLRNPEVMELFLNRHAHKLPNSKSFANGVASAAAVWHSWAPNSDYLRKHCLHKVRGTDIDTTESWERNVRILCRPEFLNTVDQLRLQKRMDELFRVAVFAYDEVLN